MPGACGSESRTSRGIGQTRRRERAGSTGAASQSWSAPHVDTPFVSSRRTSSCQTNAVASTWSALRRSAPTARPKYPASARRLQRSEEHTSELQSLAYLVCRLLLEKKKKNTYKHCINTNTY